MNEVSEQDLDLLDELLDGELPADDAERLRARLAREPQLAAALAGLEADRSVREAAWSSLVPDDAQASAFARRVSTAARRRETWRHVGRYARFGSAAAACMLLGYFAGWAGHSEGGPARGTGGTSVNQISGGGGGNSNGSARSDGTRPAGRYRVPVGYDESGRLITQDFDTLEEAQRFADEMRRWEELRQGQPFIVQEQL